MAAKKVTLNRIGLRKLIERGYSNTELAQHFQLSRQWVIELIHSERELRHPGITQYVNKVIEGLLVVSSK